MTLEEQIVLMELLQGMRLLPIEEAMCLGVSGEFKHHPETCPFEEEAFEVWYSNLRVATSTADEQIGEQTYKMMLVIAQRHWAIIHGEDATTALDVRKYEWARDHRERWEDEGMESRKRAMGDVG